MKLFYVLQSDLVCLPHIFVSFHHSEESCFSKKLKRNTAGPRRMVESIAMAFS